MRRAEKSQWLISDKNVFMGINLGSDYCAEHEWGIDNLKSLMGVPTDTQGIYGIERRRCKSPNTKCLALKMEKNICNLIAVSEWQMNYFLEKDIDKHYQELYFRGNSEMTTAWDEGSFAIRVKGEDNIKKLKTVYENLTVGKCAIWLGGGGVFQNAGLCIAIIDLLPKESLDVMQKADIDREKLKDAAKATGILQKIEEANESFRKMREVETGRACYEKKWGFFALSPSWANKEARKKTKYPVVFWLNPQDQQNNNYGWFTVEELNQWLQGKGPIPKKDT